MLNQALRNCTLCLAAMRRLGLTVSLTPEQVMEMSQPSRVGLIWMLKNLKPIITTHPRSNPRLHNRVGNDIPNDIKIDQFLVDRQSVGPLYLSSTEEDLKKEYSACGNADKPCATQTLKSPSTCRYVEHKEMNILNIGEKKIDRQELDRNEKVSVVLKSVSEASAKCDIIRDNKVKSDSKSVEDGRFEVKSLRCKQRPQFEHRNKKTVGLNFASMNSPTNSESAIDLSNKAQISIPWLPSAILIQTLRWVRNFGVAILDGEGGYYVSSAVLVHPGTACNLVSEVMSSSFKCFRKLVCATAFCQLKQNEICFATRIECDFRRSDSVICR
jgi:hypothetical protein